MKKWLLLLVFSLPAYALKPEVCGRYLMVGHYSCEASSCQLKVYPKSDSEMIFHMEEDPFISVKKLTGKTIRARVSVFQLGTKMKASVYQGAAMEYPEELGPKAFQLIQEEKCRP